MGGEQKGNPQKIAKHNQLDMKLDKPLQLDKAVLGKLAEKALAVNHLAKVAAKGVKNSAYMLLVLALGKMLPC